QDCAKPTVGSTNSWQQRNNSSSLRWNKNLRPFAEGGRGPSRKISNHSSKIQLRVKPYLSDFIDQ
ncbi:MAG: hypothetical protein OSA43_01375, partial [Pirellulales bacterium]|nr:hypothetical protein [Pirellulales bacterium]